MWLRIQVLLAFQALAGTLIAEKAEIFKPERKALFALVGGAGHLNKRCLQVRIAGLDLLLDTGREIDPATFKPQDHDRLVKLIQRDQPLIRRLRKAINTGEISKRFPQQKKYSLLKLRNGRFGPVSLIVCAPDGNHYFRARPGTDRFLPIRVYQHLPHLKVQGEHILRSDSGEKIIFKGVSLFHQIGQTPRGSSLFAMVKSNVEENERLGMVSNLLRVSYFSHEISEDGLAGFEDVANYLSSKGMYLVLTPHNVQLDEKGNYIPFLAPGQRARSNYYLPDAADMRVLSDLAKRLRGFSNIIYGLWNEPANTTWEEFEGVIKTISEGILKNFPKGVAQPLLLVPGMNWSRDFRGARIPLVKDSYLVDVHEYPTRRGSIRFMYESMINQVPILFSEMGGVISRDYRPQSGEDIARIRSILFDTVNAPEYSGAMHYCIWKGDDSPDGVRNAQGGLSARGSLVLEEKQRFPTQYDFLAGESSATRGSPAHQGHPAP